MGQSYSWLGQTSVCAAKVVHLLAGLQDSKLNQSSVGKIIAAVHNNILGIDEVFVRLAAKHFHFAINPSSLVGLEPSNSNFDSDLKDRIFHIEFSLQVCCDCLEFGCLFVRSLNGYSQVVDTDILFLQSSLEFYGTFVDRIVILQLVVARGLCTGGSNYRGLSSPDVIPNCSDCSV